MKTRISVIIPVYNVQEFLEECVDSVLAQTINDLELTDGYERNLQIILVDDGSTDSSPEIAKRYAEEHENVEYVYEENQGLGHARNYGCEFAVGDYIIFLDSDDIVPPNAYELMYAAALRNGSDMTIGNVWRFRSDGPMFSTIHKVAFNGTKEVTHITQSPELFYDTTAWNKLIKRDFWQKHEFEFPEGILYEDIPVTIPMHFLANNVSIVYENCYLWRVREGISKSITQTTDESKNLTDRLYAMGKVDEFYRKNVDDEKLHHVKTMKWLRNDLMIFINKIKSSNESESLMLMEGLRDYITNNINPDDFKYLNEFNRLKYEYLMENNFKKLFDLLTFQFETLKVTKVYKKGPHVMFDCDESIFKKSPFCIDQYIRESDNFKYIDNADFGDENIEITGFCLIPGLNVDSFDERKYSFTLVNTKSRKKIPLNHEDVKISNLTSSYDIRYGRRFSYEYSGYKLSIPYSLLSDDPDFQGENKILVSFKQDDLSYNFFAGLAEIELVLKNNLLAKIYDDSYFRFRFTLKNEIIIDVSPIKDKFNEITQEDNNLCIHSPNDDNLFVYYPADSINAEKRVPLLYDEDRKCHIIDAEKLTGLDGEIIDSNGNHPIYKSKDVLSFHMDCGQCIIDTTRDYYIKVSKFEDTTEISSIKRNGSTFDFTAGLFSSKKHENLKSASLFFKNNLNQMPYTISEGKFSQDGDEIRFKLDLSKKDITKNMNFGSHGLYVKVMFFVISFFDKSSLNLISSPSWLNLPSDMVYGI